MSNNLIALVGIIYLWVSITSMSEKHYGMALVFAAYALANVGLIMVNKGA